MTNSESKDLSCLNCGKCCIFIGTDGVRAKCKWLIRLPNGHTLCRMYRNRFHKDCGHGMWCEWRANLHMNFPGCPNNKPEWDMSPAWRQDGSKG